MPERCTAACLMLDDRWGAIRCACELERGHAGDHRHALTATMPLAHLVWPPDDSGGIT